MEFWQIILGVVTAVFLIFLRGAHSKAHQQKIAAARLRSYLLYWQGVVMEYNLFGVYQIGVNWNEEIEEIVQSGIDGEKLVALESKKKEEIEELKKHLEEKSDEIEFGKEEIYKLLKHLPENGAEYFSQYIIRSSQNIVDGKTFIRDDEASQLGAYITQVAVQLKLELLSLLSLVTGFFMAAMSDPEGFDLKDSSDDLAKLIWKGVLVSKHIDTLSKKVEAISNMSIMDLTLVNLRGRL